MTGGVVPQRSNFPQHEKGNSARIEANGKELTSKMQDLS
jgi:hypothetical protein